jgi:Beta-lactamase enzyme family
VAYARRVTGRLTAVALLLAALVFTIPASADAAEPWAPDVAAANAFVGHRRGDITGSVRTPTRSWGSRAGYQMHSASVVKAMLLVAYLNQPKVRHHHLDFGSRALLRPMIIRSDNNAASRVRRIVGNVGLERVARRAHMQHFASDPNWGDTHIAAADQARFFFRIDRLLPPRHRRYGLSLLAHVVGPQRWGIPQGLPGRTRVFFKGGWRPENGGWIIHQVALVERGNRRASLAVLTDDDRTDGYGHETIRGIARRVLRPLARP